MSQVLGEEVAIEEKVLDVADLNGNYIKIIFL